MASFRDVSLCVMATSVFCCAAGRAQQQGHEDLLDRAQGAVVSYISKLAEVHCTEDVEQVKVLPNGRPEASLKTQYDYFVLLQGTAGDLQLAESRLATASAKQRQQPLLLSNGFSMLLLIFHPYYRGGFTFTPEGQDDAAGRRVVRYHFAHVDGARTPAALALRDREYPLDLQGSAWIDAETGQPLRIDAELLHPMTDIGLRSLKVHVEYAPVVALAGHPVLVSVADVDLETPRQHWKNSHLFRDYKLFSTDATQDPNVKVHASASETQGGAAQSSTQEKP
jgi:hypothetical protein